MPSQLSKDTPKRRQGPQKSQIVPEHPSLPVTFRDMAMWAGILVTTLMAYSPALHGGLVWDDAAHLTSKALQPFQGLWRIWFELGATQQFYPLLHSAFWIEHRLWGNAVLGYHLINVIEHAIGACLLIAILRRLELPGAWLAGWIFALHPVCVEGVAWISEQKDTLSGVFYFTSALLYLNFDRSRKRSHYFWAFGFFVLALASKSVVASLPAALLVIFWWQRGRIEWKRDTLPLVPWFVVGAAAGLFTAWVERTYIGARGPEYELTLAQHLLLTGRIICFYAIKLVWPANLIFSYPHWNLDATVWLQYLYALTVLLVAGGLVLVARRDSGPVRRGPLAGFLFFVGTLFPVLGFLHVYPFRYSYVADHFQYLAALGIIVPVSWLIWQGWSRVPRPAGNAAVVVLLAVLGILTWWQSGQYRDSETLYRTTLTKNPTSWMVHNNFGIYLAGMPGRLQDAAAEFRETLRLKPDHAKAHMNLGNALFQMGRLPEAIAEYQASLQLDPNYAPTHDDLGIALMQAPERLPEAIAEFQAALRLKPNNAQAHELLAMAYAQMPDKLPDAFAEYKAALRLAPDDPDIHMNFGDTLSKLPERRQEAIAQYQAAIESNPDSGTRKKLLERVQALTSE